MIALRLLISGGFAAAMASAAIAAWLNTAPEFRPFVSGDDFESGLCTRDCAGAIWATMQQEGGHVATVPAPGRPGAALRVFAAAKQGRVTKADVIARTVAIGEGRVLSVAFDLRVPAGTPLNSIELLDMECATCGEGGNPGIRLYLRRGRLRIDRSKIGIADAWVRDDAPQLKHDRWHHITIAVRIGAGENGSARVTLDGREVLAARGATIMSLGRRYVDRVQIGATANSNAVPVTLFFDNIAISAR